VTGGFLLDTQALLWLLAGDRRLSRAARQVILKEESKLAASAASAWEIVLKHRAGKLQLEVDLGEVLEGLSILTADRGIRKYPATTVW